MVREGDEPAADAVTPATSWPLADSSPGLTATDPLANRPARASASPFASKPRIWPSRSPEANSCPTSSLPLRMVSLGLGVVELGSFVVLFGVNQWSPLASET